MKRAIRFPILGLLLIIPSVASAETVSIAGVTVSNTNRKGGISVRLADAKTGGTILDSDTSSTNGVYNLSTVGVQPGVTGLWVIDGGSAWKSRPYYVPLGPAAGGVRRAKAEDIDFKNIQQQTFNANEAASLLAGLQETAAIEVRAGARTEADARLKLAADSTQILANVPDLEPGSPEALKVTRQALGQINGRVLGEPILKEDDLMGLTHRQEFKNMSLRNRSREVYQRYLSNPGAVPIDILLQGKTSQNLQQEVESRMAPGVSGKYKLYIKEDGTAVLLDPREPLTVNKGVQVPEATFKQWLQANPEARTYLFYRKVLDEKLLPESELKKVEQLLREKVLVVEPNG